MNADSDRGRTTPGEVDALCEELMRVAIRAAAGSKWLARTRPGEAFAAVKAVVDGVQALDQHLELALTEAQNMQLDRCELGPELSKVNIGAGDTQLEGWINTDLCGADVDIDLRRGLPFADRSVSHIYASHVLEHLGNPGEAVDFLSECRRVLCTEGRIRIVVPDLAPYLRAYVDDDAAFWDEHAKTWDWWDYDAATPLELILRFGGAGLAPGDLFGHRFGYDAATMEKLLSASGFVGVRQCGFQASPEPLFRVDDASLVAAASYQEQPLSLFFEAMKIF